MNENELLIEIQKHNETIGQLADYLGIETQTLERKMSDDTDCDFTMGEIKKIKAVIFIGSNAPGFGLWSKT